MVMANANPLGQLLCQQAKTSGSNCLLTVLMALYKMTQETSLKLMMMAQ